ncbi:MAG: type IV toxin-antitoxin system AbiEi family antitoxin domain-containing protein, partial [Actinomycetota bacterium]
MRPVLLAQTRDRALAELAARQLGLVNRSQALEIGFSPETIRNRVKRGYWTEVLPGVYRLPGGTDGLPQRVMAAILWAGKGAVASHRCAAWLRGWDGSGRPTVEITTTRRLSKRPGIIVHRSAPLLPQDVDRLGPIPVTGAARTLLDIGSVLSPENAELALEDALRRGHVTLARLRWQVAAQGGPGRHGTAGIRTLLKARPPGYRTTKSGLEVKVRRLLLSASLPEPIYEYRV